MIDKSKVLQQSHWQSSTIDKVYCFVVIPQWIDQLCSPVLYYRIFASEHQPLLYTPKTSAQLIGRKIQKYFEQESLTAQQAGRTLNQ